MALVRCPQCGRVAEPPSCFACGHAWSEDAAPSPSAFDKPEPPKAVPPGGVDFGFDLAPPPPVPAAAPMSDPMSEAGDLFGVELPPAPIPAAPAMPPAIPVDDDFEVDFDANEIPVAQGIPIQPQPLQPQPPAPIVQGTPVPAAPPQLVGDEVMGLDFGALDAANVASKESSLDFGVLDAVGNVGNAGNIGTENTVPPAPPSDPGFAIDFSDLGGAPPSAGQASAPVEAAAVAPAASAAAGTEFGVDFSALGGRGAPSPPDLDDFFKPAGNLPVSELPAATVAQSMGAAVGESPEQGAFEASTVALQMDSLPADAMAEFLAGKPAAASRAEPPAPPDALDEFGFGLPSAGLDPDATEQLIPMPTNMPAVSVTDPDATEAFPAPSVAMPTGPDAGDALAPLPPEVDLIEQTLPPPPDLGALDFGEAMPAGDEVVPAPPGALDSLDAINALGPEEPPAPPTLDAEPTVDFPDLEPVAPVLSAQDALTSGSDEESSDDFSLDDLPDLSDLDDLDDSLDLDLPPAPDDFADLDDDSGAVPPSSARANPTVRAPAITDDTVLATYDAAEAKRLSGEVEKLAEGMENDGKIGEAALLYELQTFLETLF